MHLTSKLRQLIEQVFEIMLSEHTEFSVQQIVWAKVQQYPAWPAKIVRKLNQHGKTVYKLNFFGDPSYCYLHSQSLSSFSQFDFMEENLMEHDLKLKRAFELAKFYFSKQLEKISYSNTQQSHLQTETIHPLAVFEQTKIQSKELIDLPQKLHLNQIQNITNNDLNSFNFTQITPQNVLDVLDNYHNAKNASLLENLKRKQIICFQNDLKQNLLFKYKLNAVDFLKQTQNTNQSTSNQLKQKRLIKKDKRKNVVHQFNNKQLCIRRIQKMLIQKGIQRHMASKVAIKLIDNIQNNDQNSKSLKNEINFKQNIIKVLYEISSKIKQIQQIEMQYLQKQILSLIDIDSHSGNKMEQVLSRTTQMGDQYII